MTSSNHNTNIPTGSIPQPERDAQGRIKGDFYAIQKPELVALHKRGILNNSGYVHLALRYENPFLDRPVEIIPKEFSARWEMAESSVYAAIAKLKEEKVIVIKQGRILVEWVKESFPQAPAPSPQNSRNLESLVYQHHSQQGEIIDSQQESDSRNLEFILESKKKFSESRMDSRILENGGAEPTYTTEPDSLQTLQSFSNPSDAEMGQKKAVENKEVRHEVIKPIPKEIEPKTTEQVSSQQKPIQPTQQLSRWQNFGRECEELVQALDNHGVLHKVEGLVADMRAQGVEATNKVIAAIKECHISQLMFALNYVANTREDITNPSSVFVYQAYRAPIEALGPREPIVTAESMGYWDTPVEEAVGNLARLKDMLRGKRRQQ